MALNPFQGLKHCIFGITFFCFRQVSMALNPFQGLKPLSYEVEGKEEFSLNGPKSLSGIETTSRTTLLRCSARVSMALNPFQGLKRVRQMRLLTSGDFGSQWP